jgi:hypothetical protein
MSETKATRLIKLTFSTVDRFRESRTYKTLEGARKYAHRRVGAHPDISEVFWYAVGQYGDAKLEIREGTTYAELFPPPDSTS